MESIASSEAPAAIGPYSQAVRVADFVFCSGQIGINPVTKELAGEDVTKQCQQVFENIKAVLKASGLELKDIVKTTVFITNMEDFPVVNDLYGKAFGDHKPARSTVQVSRLPMDALIEIECIATLKR